MIVEVTDEYETKLLEERNSFSAQMAAEASCVQAEKADKSNRLSLISIIIAAIMLITSLLQCISTLRNK